MGRFKDSFLKDKKYWKETLLVLLGGIIINVACFLMCSLTGHCANQQTFLPSDFIIPYSIPDMKMFNPSFDSDAFKASWENNIAPMMLNWYGNQISTSDYIVSVREYDQNNNRWSIDIVCHPTIASGINVDHNFSQEIQVSGNWFGFTVSASDYTYVGNLSSGFNGHFFLGNHSTITIGDVTYLANYPVLLCGNDLYSGDTLVITNQSLGGSINVGDFTDLPNIDEILNNISNTWVPPSTITGHALPNQPTENPNNNDFQNRLQMFDYLKDSINAIVGNLGYNLKNWIDNLVAKMVQGFNSVSNNIWNGFKTLMDNIKDFFGPKIDSILEKINYITEPFDQEEINDFIESSYIYTDISSINTSVSTFGTSFTGVSEPDDYAITFHIEDIDILNQSDPFVLHLNILNPVKSTLRAFLWVIVSYGLFISVVDSLPNYINGGGGEDD